MRGTTGLLKWSGILLILITGFIHVIETPENFLEAVYKGVLFYANGAASVVAAGGLYLRREWAWRLGFVISIGSLIGYVLSRTVGLPSIPPEPDAWLEPLGVVSLITEVLFIAVFFLRPKRG